MYSYLALILVGGAFGLYFGAEELKVKPLQLFTRYFFYIVVDLFMKYGHLQQLPAENIKPFLTQKINKTKSQVIL